MPSVRLPGGRSRYLRSFPFEELSLRSYYRVSLFYFFFLICGATPGNVMVSLKLKTRFLPNKTQKSMETVKQHPSNSVSYGMPRVTLQITFIPSFTSFKIYIWDEVSQVQIFTLLKRSFQNGYVTSLVCIGVIHSLKQYLLFAFIVRERLGLNPFFCERIQ